MHTFAGKTCVIHHNSDMSGSIDIIQRDTNEAVKISGEDILEFVADFIRSEKISKLEQSNWKDILL